MCSPGKKKKKGSRNSRITYDELLQIKQKANVHSPLSDTRVMILDCDVCVCVCVYMYVCV